MGCFVEPSSYIEFETNYDGTSYVKWEFDGDQMIVYDGLVTIEWVQDNNPHYVNG